jgi:acyl carrier protein
LAATNERLEKLREITAEVLELEPDELTDEADFVEEYDADSLRAVELASRIEKVFKIEIPQDKLPEMTNLKSVYALVGTCAKWTD